jgi:hypothetical protein
MLELLSAAGMQAILSCRTQIAKKSSLEAAKAIPQLNRRRPPTSGLQPAIDPLKRLGVCLSQRPVFGSKLGRGFSPVHRALPDRPGVYAG